MPNYWYHRPLRYYPSGGPMEFRVLKVHGGPKDSPIRCEIQHYPLPQDVDSPASVEYEALSWTWGDEDDAATIIISGDVDKTFPVKPNLKVALEHLRHPVNSRNLWVDFVCINQSNDDERAAQVKLMFFIYSKASNVCIWLGIKAHGSDVAVKFVKEEVNDLSKWTKTTEEDNKYKWAALAALMDRKWFGRRWIVQELALAKKASVHCSDAAMDWTEFETAVALFDRDAPRLSGYYKGSKDANFDHNFFGDVTQMGATRLVHLKSNLFRLDEYGKVTEYRFKLTDLVSNLWSFDAQDPHDLIYAILSIARDTYKKVNIPPQDQPPEPETPVTVSENGPTSTTDGADAPMPHQLSGREEQQARSVLGALRFARDNKTVFNINYRQDFFLVCKQFLKHVIPDTETHNLDIILRPWSPFQDKRGVQIKLPTWIPTVKQAAFKRQKVDHAPGGYRMVRQNADPLVGQVTHGSRGSPYNACHSQKAERKDWELFEGAEDHGPDRSLIVTGFILDRIGSLEDASQHGSVPKEWLVLGGWHGESGERLQATDTLWRTLVADRGPDGRNTMPYYHKAFDQAVLDSPEGIDAGLVESRGHPVLSEFLKRMKAVVTNRRLFKSRRRGNLGLAPKQARDGDYVCIVKGMSVAVILRPVEGFGPLQYHLIGECYLHTMMDGRAIDHQEARKSELERQLIHLTDRIKELDAAKEGNVSDQRRRNLRDFKKSKEEDEKEIVELTLQRFELR